MRGRFRFAPTFNFQLPGVHRAGEETTGKHEIAMAGFPSSSTGFDTAPASITFRLSQLPGQDIDHFGMCREMHPHLSVRK
jgi:hypothetical protein